MQHSLSTSPRERLRQIEQARQMVLHQGAAHAGQLPSSWLADSWRRCLSMANDPSSM